MLLMDAEVPVRLETLDQSGQRVSEVEANLVQLDDRFALVSLEGPASSVRLHWGTPIRFELDDGMKRYEVTGAIVARREDGIQESGIGDASAVAAIPTWELRIRIWDCKLNVQRRMLPRRRIGFLVHLHAAAEAAAPCESADQWGQPILARCVDIGAGGIRVRTPKLDNLPTRMRLEFCLPVSDGEHGVEATHKFCLAGRVIRALPQGRNGDNMDIAFCFEGLSVRDGMALHNLLT